MPARVHHEPLAFAAPVGARVRLVSLVTFILLAAAVVVCTGLWAWLRLPDRDFWPMLLAPLSGLVVVVPVYWHQRVLGYRLTAEAVEIDRPGRVDRLDLAGLQQVEADPQAMAWSLKLFGNDGLGAITGRFRNRRLGPYRAFVTDRARAVVLRWPDRCVVVSPDRPAEFAAALRRRAGLKGPEHG